MFPFFNLSIFKFFSLILPVLLSVAFVTLLERKVLSLIGSRVGPNKVSMIGFFQPMSDALKLMGKQVNTLSNFNFNFYMLSSSLLFVGSIFLWGSYVFDSSIFSLKFSFLFLFVILSLNSLSSVLAGWSTFSKFSLIGSIRTVCQLVSYEAGLYICFFSIILTFFCFSFGSLFYSPLFFSVLVFSPFFLVWVPSVLAELNRSPFDFSEGESELVSGFNTEFGSSGFTLLFLAEYSNIIFFSFLTSFMFFLGVDVLFFVFFLFFIVWIRAVLPRYRFDKLMFLAWKFYIPFLTFCFLCLIFSF